MGCSIGPNAEVSDGSEKWALNAVKVVSLRPLRCAANPRRSLLRPEQALSYHSDKLVKLL